MASPDAPEQKLSELTREGMRLSQALGQMAIGSQEASVALARFQDAMPPLLFGRRASHEPVVGSGPTGRPVETTDGSVSGQRKITFDD